MAGLDIRLLGPPAVQVDGAPLQVDTRKAVALVAYLAVTGRTHPRDALVDLLWPDGDPESARAALRRTLSVLRKGLDDRWLVTTRDSVTLASDSVELDVVSFRTLLECGQTAEAVALARGEFMEGFGLRDSASFDDWQLGEAQALRRELGSALERLALEQADRGELVAAVGSAERRLALDPLSESAQRLLIRLHAWRGDRAAALEQYRECVRTLHRELGVAPVEETTALYEAVSEGRLPAHDSSSDARATVVQRDEYPLVGREAELRELVEGWESAGLSGRLLVIEGEGGIGKSRLADELAGRAGSAGSSVVAVRAREGEAELPYAVIAEALRAAAAEAATAERLARASVASIAEASRLVPELASLVPGAATPQAIEGPGQRGRFVAGLSDVLLSACTGEVPGLLVVDDAQWADTSSLEVVTYLMRRLEGRPASLLLTWRPDAVARDHPLRTLVAEARRAGRATVVAPARLGPEAVAELARAADLPAQAERVYTETDGLPLFVVEYLAALARGEQESTPSSVLELLRARAAAVGEVPGQVLAAAAVLGSFDFDAVRDASGRDDDETVAAIEELVRRTLLSESADGYRFAHEKLREVVYADTSLARRRLLHRRSAETLAQARRNPGPRAGLIAEHFRLAGQDAQAAEYHRLAGEHARSLSANAEAISHFQSALALGHPDEAALHEAIGELLTLQGDYGAALNSLEAAAALTGETLALARIEHKLGVVHQRRGDRELAATRLEAAALAAAGDPALSARIEADRSLNEHGRGRPDEALAHAEDALSLAETAGDATALAQVHNLLGILATGRGDLPAAREELERSLALAEQLGEPGPRVAALNNLALVARGQGELDRAMELTESALELCAVQGDRHREAALHNNLADLLHEAGRSDEAMSHLKQAVAIFAEVGADAGVAQPEIWKLVEW